MPESSTIPDNMRILTKEEHDASHLPFDVSPEMAELLRAGAADHLGIICRPSHVEKNWAVLRDAQRLGFVRFPNIEQPIITDAGRAVVGLPSESDAGYARIIAAFGRRKPPLVPVKRDDPRTDFDYRSYKTMGWSCTLVVKQPDRREGANTIRVGKTLKSDPQFLGPRNSIVLPESEGRFVLAIVPNWLVRLAPFSAYPLALDETEWSADECATWDRLRNVCHSVNSRIRSAGRRAPERFRYGENA